MNLISNMYLEFTLEELQPYLTGANELIEWHIQQFLDIIVT